MQAALIPPHPQTLNIFFLSQTHTGINDQKKLIFLFLCVFVLLLGEEGVDIF